MLMAMYLTLASSLANGTVNNPGKQKNVYFKHNRHKHTENRIWRDGRLVLGLEQSLLSDRPHHETTDQLQEMP